MNTVWRSRLIFSGSLFLLFPAAQAQSNPTPVEQNDPSITYTGTWYPNTESPNSGGSATLTNERNARAAITFNGTGITWIGVLDPYSGIAQVYLDGTLNTIDTYAPSTKYQQPIFTARGLSPGMHTLSIAVLHLRDGSTSGSWIWIDRFDIDNGSGVTTTTGASAGRVEQDDPSVNYTGSWFPNHMGPESGGSAVLATDGGSRATITFNGTSVRWLAYRDAWSGIANIYLDGTLHSSVDTYVPVDQAQSTAFEIGGLSPGTHSLTIEVTGTHSAHSGGSWIWVDAFDVR